MLPKILSVHGFRSYVDTVINFADYGKLFAVTGQNGAGKSSIIEMITTVLYYRNTCTDERGAGMDDVINRSCDHFELDFTWTMNDVEYRVWSFKKREGDRKLRFWIAGREVTGKVTETQQLITETIRLSYDTFLDTVCVAQGQSARFMAKTPGERRQVFAQLLGLDRFDAYEAEAKNRRKRLRDEVAELDGKVNFLADRAEDPVEIDAKLVTLRERLTTTADALKLAEGALTVEREAMAKHAEAERMTRVVLAERESLQADLTKVRARVNALERAIAEAMIPIVDDREVDELTTTARELTVKANATREEVTNLKIRHGAVADRIRQITAQRERIVNLGEGTCTTCGAAITAATKRTHVEELDARIAEGNRRLDLVKADVERAVTAGQAVDGELTEVNERLHKLTTAKAEAERVRTAVAAKEDELTSLRPRLVDLEDRLRRNMATIVTEEPVRTWHDGELAAKVDELRTTHRQLTSAIAVGEEKLTRAKTDAGRLTDMRAKLTSLRETLADANAVVDAFGRNGIPAQIVNRDLPNIEREVNEVANALTDGETSVTFITKAEVGKGKNRKEVDTLDVVINDARGSRRYASYSGGERFRIDFALHVGMARYLTHRAGASIDLFVVDEGLGSQDDEGRQRFVETVRRLGRVFKQVMLITHVPELQDSFGTKVVVVNDPLTGSRVEKAG